ncbi:hypothetical protein Poly30_39340 [Planctomycetes bacterium Poly30]|uniref:Uncharacterized protein n=1 Tax=Saltatorellus ferox TaxID=2528018 RepID=A0A518EWE8_9BACT|nr:hypothetical protein Poly30_39340 [Planctomycetes bacterium Poly30]
MQRSRLVPSGSLKAHATVAFCLVLAVAWSFAYLVPSWESRAHSVDPFAASSLGGVPRDAAAAPVVVRVTDDGACTISGEAASDSPHPVFLTALRYERAGETWIVADFVNIDLGDQRAFVLQGLIPGRWFVAARGFTDDSPAWGRSPAIELTAEHSFQRTSIVLKRFEVDVVVHGLPEELKDEVYLSMDWEEGDRVQVEGDEFLDLPDDACPRTDWLQTFGSLENVGTIWMVSHPPSEADGSTEDRLDTSVDPWGLARRRLSWITPAWEKPLSLHAPGPGRVTVTLHGLPGAEAARAHSVDLTPSLAKTVLEFSIDADTLPMSEDSF